MAEAKTVTFSNSNHAREFQKIWEYRPSERKELSHWSRHEFPLLQLVGKLDTDHWAKLKRRHKQYARSTVLPLHSVVQNPNDLPKPSNGLQLHYYDVGKRRQELLQEGRTLYGTHPDAHHATIKKAVSKKPSIYNEHARNGFKFWMDEDPHVRKISFCSKYTFGSKHTVHGLGNAPRN